MRRMPSKRKIQLTRFAALSLGAAAVVCGAVFVTQTLRAQEPSVEERMRQRREEQIRGGGPAGPSTTSAPEVNAPPRPLDRPEPESPEWLAAAETMKKHTPNWWRRFERGGPDAPGRPRVMRGI